ncbi:MAG: glycosyltransferase family 39 protein [Rhodoglobus sp.]
MIVQTVPQKAWSSTRTHHLPPALVLGAIGALVGFLGSWIPSYWGDEAASVISASRSWSSLAAELSAIDGVHGVYYAFLHVWTSILGTSELATRLPSAIAAGATVAGVVVLVRHLGDSRLAVLAGVVAAVLPRTTLMATEARSYAMGTAAAVWLTILLVTLLRRRASSGWWIAYAVAVAASVYLFLYLGLLLLVHACYVLVAHREAVGNWVRAAVAAALLSAPVILLGYLQRQQIEFLARRHYATAPNVLVMQWFGTSDVAVFCWALILLAVGWIAWNLRRGHSSKLGILAVLWLVIPTAALLVGNETVSPIYNVRYLTFSTPAAAILIAIGISVIARAITRSSTRTFVAVVLSGILMALCVPVYLSQRTEFAKDGGSDLRQVANFIQANASAGDAVVFDQTTKPSRDPRLALRLYPTSFSAVRDVEIITPFDQRALLWDEVAPIRATATQLAHSRSVWAVELAHGGTVPSDVDYLDSLGFDVASTTLIHRTTIYQLVRN